MGQESMSECELLRAEIESLKIDLQAMLGLRRTGSTSTIEKRLERVESILDARGLDWDHPRVEDDHFAGADKMVAEPPKKWRIRQPGEVIKQGDWVCSKSLPSCSDPINGLGWMMASICVGSEVMASDECVFACPVAEEPTEPAKHPARLKPDPGEGYRILSKNPIEELQDGDECQGFDGAWFASGNAQTHRRQEPFLWYRRKIEVTQEPPKEEPPKPSEPKYREPVLPADVTKQCEFSMTGKDWYDSLLAGFQVHGSPWISSDQGRWKLARIRKDA